MNLTAIFSEVLNMSLTASIVILVVYLARFLLRKAPKIYSYLLWALVLFRLLCPVSVSSAFSVMPDRITSGEVVSHWTEHSAGEAAIQPDQPGVDEIEGKEPTAAAAPNGIIQPASTERAALPMLPLIWLVGMGCLLLYSAVSYIRLRRQVRIAVPLRKNVYIADDAPAPFVMGFFRPKIYLPGTLTAPEREMILSHEQHHIRRGDPIFKALGFLALSIHWFNPLVWLAFILACRDMEMSCDEAVIRKLGEDIRADYSAALLNVAAGHRLIASTPLAFGESDPKGRIRNLANWKKPRFWIVLLCITVCIVLAFCLLTNPKTKLPFMDTYRVVEHAEIINLRSQNAIRRSYTIDECEELGYRLRDLDGVEPCEAENTDSPIFRLEAEIQNVGDVSIQAIPGEDRRILLYCGAEVYWILDDEFQEYLWAAVNGESIFVAEETSLLTDWGVSIKPERVSRTGATAAFAYSGSVPGEEGAELSYGDFLSLDRLENGMWVSVPELPGYEYTVGDSSYPVEDGYGMVHEWDDRFGALPDGQYRLGKLVTLHRPDGSMEKQRIYGEFSIPDSILTGPIPLEDLPERYGGEEAMIDGCLVLSDGYVLHNKEQFQLFAERCAAGEAGFFRIVNGATGDPAQRSIYDLTFDGETYTLEWLTDGRRQSKTYRCLMHYTGEKEREDQDYDAYEHYVLVNDDTVSWQDIWAQSANVIDHWTVYSDYIYLPKKPEIPANPVQAVLEYKGEPLVTVTEPDRLENIHELFASAELLGYEPKTHSVGVDLNLLLTDRSGEDFIIELDPDQDICRINGEYVFYGAFDEPDYILKLWEYLGITRWPDIVYQQCENALRP